MTGVEWTTTHGDRVQVYVRVVRELDETTVLCEWRWRVRARNNRILGGGEGHPSRRNAIRAALRHHPRVEP